MKRFLVFGLGLVVAATALTIPLSGTRKTFKPDWTFKGSTLAGWTTLGAAQWTAVNGELVGKATAPEGGWLVLDKSFQDVEFGADFRCADGCKTAVLLRAQKTATGMKGLLVSLDGPALASFAVTLDANGKELSRQPISPGGGMARFAPGTSPSAPPPPRAGGAPADAGRGGGGAPADAGRRGGGAAGAPGGAPGGAPAGGRQAAPPPGAGRGVSAVASIVPRPSNAIKPNDWNDLDIIVDVTLLRPHVNSSNAAGGGAINEEMGAFGPIALYIGGTGEVRFRDVSYKDLNLKRFPVERTSSNFRMQRLNQYQYSWSQAAADVDKDGNLDIIVPPFIYMGPSFTTAREFYAAETLNPSTVYPSIMVGFAGDYTGDGWVDFLSTNGGRLYINPKGEPRRWDVVPSVVTGVSEICVMKDVDADGKLDLVHVNTGGTLAYSKPDPANPTGKWITQVISEPQSTGGHGIGAGDINGDGKVDIVNAYGWWEQPAAGPTSGIWKHHPQAFSRWTARASEGGGEMSIFDVNGDRLNDVVTALQAHGYGLAWYEQKKDASGNITFVEHIFSDDMAANNAGGVSFSEPHGETAADMDGDGVMDFVVGKRQFSHHEGYLDPDGGNAEAVLYVFYTRRDRTAPGGARMVPELIHNQSGAGSQVLAADVNKDGVMDVVTSGTPGAYVFFGRPRGARATTAAPAAAAPRK
jgi:hypothetical protein